MRALLARLRRHLGGRGEWWWAPLVYLAAVLWLYRGLWHQHGAPYALGWDVVDQYGPDLEFLADDLASGRLSLWNPYDRGGYPLIADPSVARYYPAGWPFVAASAALGAPWWMIQVKVLAHHVVAGAAMHLFVRHRGLGRAAAALAGLTVVATVPLMVHKASNIVWPMVWAPLGWIAIDRLCARPGWRRAAAVAAAIIVPGTAGAPPGFFYTLLLVGSYGAARVAGAVIAAPAPTRRRQALVLGAHLAGAGLLVGLALAITVVPVAALVPLSERGGKLGSAFALDGAQPGWASLVGVVAPTVGKLETYVGMAALLLGAIALVRPAPRWRGLVVWGAVVATLATAATFGRGTPVLPWLVEHVPGFDRIRVPGRYKLVAVWAFAPLVAVGWTSLTARPRPWRWTPAVAAGLAAALLAGCALLLASRAPYPFPQPPRAEAWPLLFAALAAALVLAAALLPARALAAIAVAAAALIATDASFFLHTPGSPPAGDPRRRHRDHDELAVLAPLGDVAVAYRLYDEFKLADRVGERRRLRDFRGYPAIDQVALSRYVDVLREAGRDPALLEAYNVRWLLTGSHYRFGTTAHMIKQPAAGGHYQARGGGVYEARHPAPLVAWVGAIDVVRSGVLPAVRALEETNGQRRRAVIELRDAGALGWDLVPLAAARAAPPASAAGRALRYEPDEVVVEIDAPARGLLVLNELWYPGWQVEIDGAPARMVRANYLLRAVVVPAGVHTVRWTFRPAGFRWLGAGYVAALGVLVLALVWRRRGSNSNSSDEVRDL